MSAIRSRIERLEIALGNVENATSRESTEKFRRQLDDLTDDELDRLEAIVLLSMQIVGDEAVPVPSELEHIRDLVRLVEDNEAAYFAALRQHVAERGHGR